MAPISFDISSTDFLIPFLFTLAIVFGVLELGGPFKKNKAVNVIVAIAIAVFAAGYAPFQTAIWNFLPSATWFFIVMFFIAFSLELFGVRKQASAGVEGMVINGAVLVILFGVGWMVLQRFPVDLPIIGSGYNLLYFIGLLFIISLFWAAMKIGGGGKE